MIFQTFKHSNIMLLMAVLLLFSRLTTSATGHSYMTKPQGDWNPSNIEWCRRGGPDPDPNDCPGPCFAENSPQFFKDSKTYTWKRGQDQTVTWHRNTHNFGFIRLTLVPKKDRMNKKVHDANAFHYACYDSNPQRCPDLGFCGTGKTEGTTRIKVPAVPDGEYVLGWTWYGAFAGKGEGLKGELFHFGDYWSCSNIRISGGNVGPVGRRAFKPQLSTGTQAGTCKSINNKLGTCPVEPCPNAYGKRRPSAMCPSGFKLKQGKCFSPFDGKNSAPAVIPLKVHTITDKCCDRRPLNKPHIGGIYLRGLDAQGVPRSKRCLCRHEVIKENEYPHGVSFEVFPVGLGTKFQHVRFRIDGVKYNIETEKPYVLVGDVGKKYNEFKTMKVNSPIKIEADLLMNNGVYDGYNIVSVTFKK